MISTSPEKNRIYFWYDSCGSACKMAADKNQIVRQILKPLIEFFQGLLPPFTWQKPATTAMVSKNKIPVVAITFTSISYPSLTPPIHAVIVCPISAVSPPPLFYTKTARRRSFTIGIMQIPAAITAPAIPIPFFIRTAVPSTTSITEPAMFPSPGIASTVFVTKLRFRESNAGERIPCTTLIPITHSQHGL